jgi:hypothetical protein
LSPAKFAWFVLIHYPAIIAACATLPLVTHGKEYSRPPTNWAWFAVLKCLGMAFYVRYVMLIAVHFRLSPSQFLAREAWAKEFWDVHWFYDIFINSFKNDIEPFGARKRSLLDHLET